VGDYYATQSTYENIDLSIKKMDFAPVRSYEHTKAYEASVCYVADHLLFSETTRWATFEEYLPEMNLSSGSGFPFSSTRNARTKRDVLSNYNDEFMDRVADFPTSTDPYFWKVSPKREWKLKSDLDKGKLRTFIQSPFEMILWGRSLYHTQNNSLKNHWWSSYGFNPYYGGTDTMARELLVNGIILSMDVGGWDRRLPNLIDVYSRLRNPHIQKKWRLAAERIAQNLLKSALILPTGEVILKCIGNNSGQVNTTTDNILAHCLIQAYNLFLLFGDWDIVEKCVLKIFGDDILMSIPFIPEGVDIESHFRSTYREFGLELDPFLVSNDLHDHTFLGFRFTLIDGRWVPEYNKERLVTSFLYSIEKRENIDASLSRMWSLCLMAQVVPTESSVLMQESLDYILNNLELGDITNVTRAMQEVGAPTPSMASMFALGHESGWLVEQKFLKDELEKAIQLQVSAQAEISK